MNDFVVVPVLKDRATMKCRSAAMRTYEIASCTFAAVSVFASLPVVCAVVMICSIVLLRRSSAYTEP